MSIMVISLTVLAGSCTQFEPQPVEGGDRWFDGPDEQAVDRKQWVEVIEVREHRARAIF